YYTADASSAIVRPHLRKNIVFAVHHLVSDRSFNEFHLIFCRNVMIYFSREEQARLAREFQERLAPEGFLFIGHSESLQGLGADYRLRIHERGIAYQKQ
ncbi:MAG: CheR family methyltransferase, partial [Pyrinomonadaceae bacterium]